MITNEELAYLETCDLVNNVAARKLVAEIRTLRAEVAGHARLMLEVDEQQKRVLAAIKKSNDAMEKVIRQRDVLKVQRDMMRGRKP